MFKKLGPVFVLQLDPCCPNQPRYPPLITIFGKVSFHLAQATAIQFNLIAIYGSSCLYGTCKFIFYQRIQDLDCMQQSLSKTELSATKVKDFQYKTVATKSSTLNIPGVPDPPLIKIFRKVSFNLIQAIVISFNLIAIYERNYLYDNYEIMFYQRRIYAPASI